MLNGSCLCGDIQFTVTGTLQSQASACHCTQCRKQSGHHWASHNVAASGIDIQGEVTWFASSETAKRGFCTRCGSFLFWRALEEDQISFALGALDDAADIALERHIFVADKGDYYDIPDHLPQKEN
ncbi:MAG: GFA family protein [Roseovarius sp.]